MESVPTRSAAAWICRRCRWRTSSASKSCADLRAPSSARMPLAASCRSSRDKAAPRLAAQCWRPAAATHAGSRRARPVLSGRSAGRPVPSTSTTRAIPARRRPTVSLSPMTMRRRDRGGSAAAGTVGVGPTCKVASAMSIPNVVRQAPTGRIRPDDSSASIASLAGPASAGRWECASCTHGPGRPAAFASAWSSTSPTMTSAF